MHTECLRIDRRFRGPPRSGNGGYTCGLIAAPLDGSAAVRLQSPPPLDTDLVLMREDGPVARLFHGDVLIGEGRPQACDVRPPAPPEWDRAIEASRDYLGFRRHTFPECFVCGPARDPGDGLRIFAGALGDDRTVAAPWLPAASLAGADGHVSDEFLWSALDCSGGFALLPVAEGTTLVLGELCAAIDGRVDVGEPCVVIGWPLHRDGRKRYAGSAVFGEGGRPVARARAVWLEVPASAWA